ncbi:hypothetical protein ACQPX6_25215 [Actinomycetospora sp. CA-101289]|uniref:hypothetical protein n=1 Tax=Actinomycetospora sp. CA-101289 TaxID=3239893 RepID=UPI003D979ED4
MHEPTERDSGVGRGAPVEPEDLGATLDQFLGLPGTESWVVFVADPAAGGAHAYGPFARHQTGPAVTQVREQLHRDGMIGVEVHVIPLHPPDEL